MSSLLDRSLVALGILTILDPLIDLLPLLPLHTQLPSQNELRRKQHHAISHRHTIADQEFSSALCQLILQEIHIFTHVH